MSYYLYKLLYDPETTLSFFRLFGYLSFRSIFAFATAFFVSVIFGRKIIKYLLKKGLREHSREFYKEIAPVAKKGTPTMGGLLIIISILVPVFLWCNLENRFIQLLIGALFWFGAIGFIDDYLKIKSAKGDGGMSRTHKLILQIAFGIVLGILVLNKSTSPFPESIINHINIPFFKGIVTMSWLYFFFIIFVVTSISNAVNFADGLDGLAVVPASVVAAVYGVFAYILGRVDYSSYLLFEHIPNCGEITVFCAAVAGAGLGFLWYNTYPAQIFMGDVGSQALGGVLAVTAILVKQEFLFLIAGGIFLAEALSVLIQDRIGIAKIGKRIFFRAPLHHTFQYRGTAEPAVVVRFWIISILLALASLATLKIR
ncbi:phospho-N-acetylmuramoyl-pentapeptide-transferase [bacterium]|nr:phospho-N-acetylmuramoyl-pentapeptide-transferase [bacterium]